MKNRIIFPLLRIVLVSLLFSATAFSEDTVVRVASRLLASGADPSVVDIVIENGQNIAGYQVMLQFDSDFLEYKKIEHGAYLPKDAFRGEPQIIPDIDPTDDSLQAILFAAVSLSSSGKGDGILATLTFTPKIKRGSSLVLLDKTVLSNKKGEVLHPILKHAKTYPKIASDLAIGSVQAIPRNTTAVRHVYSKGDEFQLRTTVRNRGNVASAAAQLIFYGPATTKTNKGGALGSVNIAPLDPNAAVEITLPNFVTVSDNSGTYYYTACIGSGNCSEPLKIEVGAPDLRVPDLVVESTTVSRPNDNVRQDPMTVSGVSTDFSLIPPRTETVQCVAYSPDGTLLATAGNDNKIHLWDSSTGVFRRNLDLDGDVYSIAFSPDGTWFASGTRRGAHQLLVWETETWVVKARFGPGNARGVGFSHDSQFLACGTDSTDGVYVYKYFNDSQAWRIFDEEWEHPHNVTSVAWHPKRHVLASGCDDTRVRVWDLSGQSEELEGHRNRVHSVAFSSNGDFIASGDSTGQVILWKNIGGNWGGQELKEYNNTVHSVVFHPGGDLLLNGANDDTIDMWNVHTGEHLTNIDLSEVNINADKHAYIRSIAFNSQGNAIAIGILNGKVRQVTVNPHTGVGLKLPPNLISDVAHSEKYTYFVLNPVFPLVTVTGIPNANELQELLYEGKNRNSLGKCIITLDTNKYDYFAFPLEPGTDEEVYDALKSAFNIILSGVGFVKSVKIIKPGVEQSRKIVKGIQKLGEVLSALTIFVDSVNILDTVADVVENSEEEQDFAMTIEPIQPEGPGWGEIFLYSLLDFVDLADADTRFVDYPVLFRISGGLHSLPSIGIKVTQNYSIDASDYAVTYEGTWDLENSTSAAPSAQPMSLADYPPFQQLSPEMQEYLLRYFDESKNTEATTAEAWQVPEATSLLANYPNPFNPETWIPYQLSEPADVTLTIYDLNGHVVRDLDVGHQRAGMYQSRARAAYWDGRNAQGEPVASGLYFYTLTAGEFTATRKMLIRK